MDLWIALLAGAAAVVFGYFLRPLRVLIVIATAVVAIVVGNGWLNGGSASTSGETSVVENYQANYKVDANGDLLQQETLDVRFYEQRRGIFRFFDESGPEDSRAEHPVEVISIQRCPSQGAGFGQCTDEPYQLYTENGLPVAKIGDANVPYPAGTLNRYIITSKQTGTLTQLPDEDEAQWYWNVVGAGWTMFMDKVTVQAEFPKAPSSVGCITGDANVPCTAEKSNDTTYTTELRSLQPLTPVTYKAMLPAQGLQTQSLAPPWYQGWIPIGVGVVLAVVMILLIRRFRDPDPSETPVFASPGDDILAYAWTWREEPPKDIFQVLMLQLRQLGVLKVTVDPAVAKGNKPKFVELDRTAGDLPQGVGGADEFLSAMTLNSPGAQKKISKSSTATGQQIKSLKPLLTKASTENARNRGWFDRSVPGTLVVLAAALLPAFALVAVSLTDSVTAAALFLIPAVAGLWANHTLKTRLTDVGLQVRDQVSGLRVALSTPASVERYEYSLKAQYFEQFLPWAVALNCADAWAEACKPPPGVENDPGSPYYSYYLLYAGSRGMSEAVSSVSEGAVSAYSASQSSSGGGGGGGFSAGGGGGGGGGGSW
ncbi:MAG: hypothetical protein CMH41_08045 [Micrococcales bacterium]|nr:hypothetical protein [Micrococcales bacterium]